MNIARQIFNNQHLTTDLIYLFGKRYKINENDKTFRWLCLNETSDYLIFLRVCELANHCCVMKNDKGFKKRIDMRENAILINDIRKWLLSRKRLIVLAMIMAQMKTFVHFEYINYKFLFRLKMSYFKKLYSSQETKVVYNKSKRENKDYDKKKY